MDVDVGTELPTMEQTVGMTGSVMHAGATGDFNPLHYDPEVAARTSPTGGLIAHGMYAMGFASRLVTAWAGGPEHILEIKMRFTAPWPMGETAVFGGSVTDVSDRVATVELWGRRADDDRRILKGTAKVRL
ncbi:MAG: dehydratase [Actinomycetota bacterium]|nr:dehydratase [Actinomycetota bacterium]